MEMTLNLPRNYVEIEEDEMMYLEGGYGYTNIALPTDLTGYAINLFIGWAVGKIFIGLGVAQSIASKCGISTNTAKGILKGAGFFGGYVADMFDIGGKIARRLDSSGNGWIGIYTTRYGTFYTK